MRCVGLPVLLICAAASTQKQLQAAQANAALLNLLSNSLFGVCWGPMSQRNRCRTLQTVLLQARQPEANLDATKCVLVDTVSNALAYV